MFWKNEVCVYSAKWVISENIHTLPLQPPPLPGQAIYLLLFKPGKKQ
jgi:hypothetical protein